MKIDLHCHTSASDGALAPVDLVDRALHYEVEVLAITDHDTTAGYESVKEYAQQQGLNLYSGAEISCEWQGHTIHIVALDFDVGSVALQNLLSEIRVSRQERAEEMLAKLQKRRNFQRHDLSAELKSVVGNGVVGRGHFAQMLIELEYVKNTPQAFDKFLKKGRVGYVKAQWPSLEDVVTVIRQAQGIPVIAHPGVYPFTSRKLNRLIDDFKQAGGLAMEVVNAPRASSEQIGMAERAQRYELFASVGSDFHRPEQTWRGLGWLAELPGKCQPVWNAFQSPPEMIDIK